MNGAVIAGCDDLGQLLEARRKNAPFIAELLADTGFQLVFGIGSGTGFAHYRRVDGDLPYFMAVPAQRYVKARYVTFLINNVPTPIPGRYVVSFNALKQITLRFLVTGERSAECDWEAI